MNTKFNSDKRSSKFGSDRKEEVAEMEANWTVSKKRLADALEKNKGPLRVQESINDALPKELKHAVRR